jgi:hypothetical protein
MTDLTVYVYCPVTGCRERMAVHWRHLTTCAHQPLHRPQERRSPTSNPDPHREFLSSGFTPDTASSPPLSEARILCSSPGSRDRRRGSNSPISNEPADLAIQAKEHPAPLEAQGRPTRTHHRWGWTPPAQSSRPWGRGKLLCTGSQGYLGIKPDGELQTLTQESSGRRL